jgi:hypothetical protein
MPLLPHSVCLYLYYARYGFSNVSSNGEKHCEVLSLEHREGGTNASSTVSRHVPHEAERDEKSGGAFAVLLYHPRSLPRKW